MIVFTLFIITMFFAGRYCTRAYHAYRAEMAEHAVRFTRARDITPTTLRIR